jgi:hypothetical protein
VVSNCMQHVIVGDAVLAGCRLDVHRHSLRRGELIVNTC